MKIARVVAALLAMVLLSSCSMSTSSSTKSDTAASSAGIGTPVRDGKFEFTVTKVDTTDPNLVRVHVEVTNIGNEAQHWSSGNQKLLAGGKEFESDMWESEGSSMDELNPGLSASAVLAFKVPPGTVPDGIELHDSMFSQGATVNL
ncbi:DUF4352 domain-containing protein [Mycobacterium sp. Root265]|uniref:DUF4352 domain-containing protein n=1 Tax=Mycobacterium sp. Root265 TaxID=1736504 RepID=UPI0009EA6A42|nr:DUF4352 domain-containing protein [Mycobacterium sp. Root265]